jgi:hypothetical protein
MKVRNENKKRLIVRLMKTEENKQILHGFVNKFMIGEENLLINVMAKKVSS